MRPRYLRRAPLADRVSLPRPGRWAALVLVLAAGVVALVVVARRPSVLTSIGGVALGAENVTWAATGLAVLVGLLALLALRRFLYDRLASRPGPIVITSFEGDKAEPETSPDVSGVLADFRDTLTRMSLSSPESIPNEPAADGVLDDARTAFNDSSNVLIAAAGLLLSLAQVRTAYRVSVQMRSPVEGRYGLSVHVARMPSGRGDVRTVWASTWTDAAAMAAHVVGAYVVVRSRLARRPPWTAWHGLEMPYELFHLGQKANDHLRGREYEKALAALHRALEIDPQNPYLRITLGQAQEQLGLFIDAGVTYADIIPLEAWHDRRLWRRLRDVLNDDTSGIPPSRWRRSPHGPDALLIARYRLVSRLAAPDQIIGAWLGEPEPGNPLRAAEHDALRARVRVWLRSYVQSYALEEGEHLPDPTPEKTLQRVEEAGLLQLRHLFQHVARVEADALIDDYRWTRGRRRPGMPVSQTGLNLLRPWARLYLDATAADLGRRPLYWPRPPQRLEFDLRRYLSLKPHWARRWNEYYNAACTVTVAMRGWEATSTQRRTLALQAVRHLERAISVSDSGYVGRYAQWLSTGDQDLNPLRETEQFIDFLDRYLPNAGLRVPRPGDLLLPLVMSHHALRLLAQVCRRHLTDIAGGSTAATRDLQVLEAALTFTRNHRHWQSRAALVDLVEHSPAGVRTLATALPQFQDDPAVRRLSEDPSLPRDRAAFDAIRRARDDVWPGFAERLEEALRFTRARPPTTSHDPAAVWVLLLDDVTRAIEHPTPATAGELLLW